MGSVFYMFIIWGVDPDSALFRPPSPLPPPTTPNMDAASDGSAHGDGANGLGLLRPPWSIVHCPSPVTLLAPDCARRRG